MSYKARRADLAVENEAELRNLLERLGDPADVRRRQAGIVEILALIGLLVGGVILPFIGWFVGLIFLWVSAAWTTREKVLGTLVVPGGSHPVSSCSCSGCTGRRARACSRTEPRVGDMHRGSELLGLPGGIAILVLLLAPLATAAFLALRLRRSAPVPYQPSPGSA